MKVKAKFHKNIDGLTLIPTIFVDKWGMHAAKTILIEFIFLSYSFDVEIEAL